MEAERTDVPLHDLRCVGPGPQSLPHVPVSVVEASQVHVGVDVLVVVVLLSRSDGLRGHKARGLVAKWVVNLQSSPT